MIGVYATSPSRVLTQLLAATAIVFGLSATSLDAHAVKPGDFTGEGSTDIAVWRPSDGYWYVTTTQSATSQTCPPCFTYSSLYGGCIAQWGLPGDTPRPADFDGDNKVDMAVWRPTTQTWWIKPSTSCGTTFQIYLGAVIVSSDVPEAADVTGDNRADIIMFRRNPPNNPYWYVRDSTSGAGAFYSGLSPFGASLQNPFATLSGAYQTTSPAARLVRYEINSFGGAAWSRTNLVGPATDQLYLSNGGSPSLLPVRGDWGGAAANLIDYARFDNSTGVWTVSYNTGSGTSGGGALPSWGLSGDKPLSGDYNNDGVADQAVFRPSSGVFYVRIPSLPCPAGMSATAPSPPFPSPQAPGCYKQWGLSTDIPVEALLDMSRNYN